MTAPFTTANSRQDAERDSGIALTLVLAATVMISLIALPILSYSMSVMRANTALSNKTERMEAVKGGLRVALAEPDDLFEVCQGGPTTPVTLASTDVNDVVVSTVCYHIDNETARSETEQRFGLAATQVGKVPPPELSGSVYAPVDPTSASEWVAATSTASETDKIWLPNLPVHGLNLRNPDGTTMPAGFPTCTVYFPGTYPDPVTLTGPTFFTSGIYYFQDVVTVEGGASVVVGDGRTPGCTTNQEAVFYADNVPGTHNMSGLGGTWVLGDRARIVVDGSNGADVSLHFNARYVASGDAGDAPSAEVSIISVNGDLGPDGTTGVDLSVPDLIQVPVSMVGSESPVLATDQDYLPSVLTPKPVSPDRPPAPTATRYWGAARVEWTAPFDGGSPIDAYTVTASSGQTCTTSGSTSCVIAGLPTGSAVNFLVVATNAFGSSDPSDPSANMVANGPALNVPSRPAAPSVVGYSGAARVSWTAAASPNAPVTGYTVTATPGGAQCTVDTTTPTPAALTCDITGLDPALTTGYTMMVSATNGKGQSAASMPSAAVVAADALGPLPSPPTPPVPPEFVPTALIDIDASGPGVTTVDVPGYISMPQGRIRIANPAPDPDAIGMGGGILAAQFDIVDGRAGGSDPVPIGLIELDVQRKFRIVSSTPAGPETSEAIVQVNQNGAYAVNSWQVQ